MAHWPTRVRELPADRPETARTVTGKMWEFFAGVPAGNALRKRLAQAFHQSGGSVRAVLRAIAASDEFWSDACVRHAVKSPADFTISIFRQLELNPS